MTAGMDLEVVQSVLRDRKIAYFVTDCALKIVEAFGATEPLCEHGGVCLGGYLPEWVPELSSCEGTLRSILAGELPRFELNWVNRDIGEEQPLYLTMVTLPWYDATGEICGLLHLIQDITEVGIIDQQLSHQRNELRLLKAQLEQQNRVLAAANAELQHLADLKAQFVMMTTHELRTPLTAIRGYVEMLLDDDFGPLPAGPRDALTLVAQSVSRLQTISEALMDATRIETERVELLLQPADLLEIVQKILAEFEPQLQKKAQQLVFCAPPSLPKVLCDRTRTEQIVSNLLSNANRYTPEGGQITVRLLLVEEQEMVHLVVEDTGIGITAEDRPKIFERFFRSGDARRTESRGVGLGLYLTQALVALQGGEIWFESTPGVGSKFYVSIPIASHAMQPLKS